MSKSYVFVDESSDDESLIVHHGLSQTPRKIYSIESSDDDESNRQGMKSAQDCAAMNSFDQDAIENLCDDRKDELTDAMSKLTLESEGSAWKYDETTGEFLLSHRPLSYETNGVSWPECSLPAKVYQSLYHHQQIGVQWAASLHTNKIGGILADDMGLGKTWLSLTFLGGLMRSKTISSALVIAPVSILRSWENEARKVISPDFVPQLRISLITSKTQRWNRQSILRSALSQNEQIQHLVITSYGLVANDPHDFVLGKCGFDYVVIDEAHKIKNDTTQVTNGCRQVCRSENTRRLLLTGTPIQNNLKEMWVLFDFATTGRLLGPYKRFKKDFGDPIELGRNKNATKSTIEAAQRANSRLQSLLKPFFLQRMKADVLSDMPPKQEFVIWTHLSPRQRQLYEDYVKSDTVNAVLSREYTSPLVAIDWLKKLIGHPLLVDSSFDRKVSTLDRLEVSYLLNQSAKLTVLFDLIQKLSTDGHRTLIFSNSTMTLDIIERVLHDTHIMRIDGTTKENDRQRYVEEFNRECSNVAVMLLSTKAGGLGLTLTGADRAVIFNPSWNPTDDSQAVDRCYRIGQKKPVEVYRFIAAGTVEEKTYEKQIFKDGINRVVTTSSNRNTERYFDKKDLSRLFTLAPKGKCELLENLYKKGRIGDVSASTHAAFFAKHNGVIGLSRHDAVYLKDTNSHSSPPNSPFGGPTPTKLVGKARRALLRKPREIATLTNDTRTLHLVDISNRFIDLSSDAPSTPDDDTHRKQRPSGCYYGFEESRSVINSLIRTGLTEKALHHLLDLLDNKDLLSKDEQLWMHGHISRVSSCLGILPN